MPISGKAMLKLFLKEGWVLLRQKSSHMIIGKGTMRETIPDHRELAKGLEIKLRKRLKKGTK